MKKFHVKDLLCTRLWCLLRLSKFSRYQATCWMKNTYVGAQESEGNSGTERQCYLFGVIGILGNSRFIIYHYLRVLNFYKWLKFHVCMSSCCGVQNHTKGEAVKGAVVFIVFANYLITQVLHREIKSRNEQQSLKLWVIVE